MSNLKQQVKRLAVARARARAAEQRLSEVQEQMEASPLGQAYIEADAEVQEAAKRAAKLDQQIRQAAVDAHGDGEEMPDGVSVVMRKVYEYDPDEAVEWAETAAPHLIDCSIDKRAFKRAAEALELPFVSIIQEPSVRISRDLSEYEGGDNE
jgi:hypothetical protein